MSDQKHTDDLLQSLESRASDAPVEEDNSPAEDIDAFLADLEGGGEGNDSTAPAKPAASEPDPFADAFASLDGDMGDLDDDPELAARLAALAPPETKKPVKKPAPVLDTPPEPELAPPAPSPEDNLPTVPEPEPEQETSQKEEKAKKSKKKKKKEGQIKVVETQRSPGFKVVMGVLKWSAIMTPVILAIWLVGAFLSAWLSTGWLILAIAALPLLLAPFIPKVLLRRGRWWHWAVPLALLTLAGLIAPWPATAGRQMSHYGHWPSATISQLADLQADSAFVRSHAFVSEFVGEQVIALAPPEKPLSSDELLARAIGTDMELVTWAETQRKAAEEAAKKQEGEGKKSEDEAPSQEEKKEESPAGEAKTQDEKKAQEPAPK